MSYQEPSKSLPVLYEQTEVIDRQGNEFEIRRITYRYSTGVGYRYRIRYTATWRFTPNGPDQLGEWWESADMPADATPAWRAARLREVEARVSDALDLCEDGPIAFRTVHQVTA
jgi:hypothetical protein